MSDSGNVAYKSAIRQKAATRAELSWYEEKDGQTVRIDASTVWLDTAYIPESPDKLELKNGIHYALIGSSYVPVVQKFKATLHKENAAGTVFSSSLLSDALWSSAYHLTLTDVAGDEVPFGLQGWTIDTVNGYLTFTKGKPKGYDAPFHISGYRYVGRKLADAVLTSDGSMQMDSSYSPEEPQDIVTKEYVDKLVWSVSTEVTKMKPPVPDTFENKSIELICDKMFEATDITTGTKYEHVVLPDYVWTVKTPKFYNPRKGKVSLLVFANSTWQELASYDLKKDISSDLNVELDEDAYADTLSSKGFYDVMVLSYTNSFSHISGLLKSHTAPVKLKFRFSDMSEIFFSDEVTLCEELVQAKDTLENEQAVLAPDKLEYTYVSGVVTPKAGSTLHLTGLDYTTLRKFTLGSKTADVTVLGEKYESFPKLLYKNYSPREAIDEKIVIPDNFYSETLEISANTYNIFGENNGEFWESYRYRVDTKSDESARVTSGYEINGTIKDACGEFDSSKSLVDTNELQLLSGVWQWPEKDFTKQGTGKIVSGIWHDVSWIRTSAADYSKCSKDGERFFTLAFNVKSCNSVTIRMAGEGLKQDPDTFEYNVSSLLVKAEGVTDWIDAKKPYDGVGEVKHWKEGCLVPSRSGLGFIYCTFGPLIADKKVFVRVGLKYTQKIKIEDIKLTENN